MSTAPVTEGRERGHCAPRADERDEDPISEGYERLLGGGTKLTLAKLSLVRIIAAIALRTWKDEEEDDPGRSRLATATGRYR